MCFPLRGCTTSSCLVCQTLEGCIQSFEAIYREHAPSVHAVARRVLRDPHAAQTAVDETFLILTRRGRTLWSHGAIVAWLLHVGFRKALELSKKRSVSPCPLGTAKPGTHFSSVLSDDCNDVEGAVERRWLQGEVRRLFGGIHHVGERRALAYRIFQGLSYRQIAHREGIPLGTAKNRVHWA